MIRLLASGLLVAALLFSQAATGPARNKPTAKSDPARQPDVIDLNNATAEELKTLPGVGDATAAKIIKARPYRTKNELVQKKIITASAYEKIRDRVVARQ